MEEKLETTTLVTDGPVTETVEKREKKWNGCRRPYLVEPFAVLYSFGLFAYISLNSEYLYYRVKQNADEFANQTSPEVVPMFSTNSDIFESFLDRNKSLSLKESFLQSAQQEQKLDEFEQALQNIVSSTASQWSLYLSFARGIPPVFMILLILSYSDVYGRKFGLVLPCIGGLLKSICYLLVERYNAPLEYLIIGNLLEGFSGYHLTVVGAGYAYIADIVPPKTRSFRFTLYTSFVFLATAIASLSVGLLISAVGWYYCFAIMSGIYGFCIIYATLLIPETVTVAADAKFSMKQVCVSTVASFRVYTRKRENPYDRTLLVVTLISLTVFTIMVLGVIDLDALFLLGDPFHFGSVAIGYFLFAYGIVAVVGPVLGIKLFQCVGISDVTMVTISALSAAVSFVVQGTATSFGLLFTVPFLNFFGPAAIPVGRSLMSKIVTPNEQGALQASVSCLNAVGELASLTILLAIYGATVAIYPGIVFLVIAFVLLVVAVVYGIVACVIGKGNKYKEMDNQTTE